jgi:hypothetical protein
VLVVDWQLVGCTYLFNVLVGLVSFIGLDVSFIGGFVGLGLAASSAESASLAASDSTASSALLETMASLAASSFSSSAS